jgi:predicted phosphodiesterase
LRVLLISDIHANLEALEAALEAVPAHDTVINLGDVVGYGASPNEACDRSRELGQVFVRGNHDKACSGISGIDDFNPIAATAASWTQQQLTPENLDWVRSLPQGPVQLGGAQDIQIVHGSPLDEDEYLLVIREALQPLIKTQAAVTFFGHTHIQGGFSLEGDTGGTIRPLYDSKDGPVRYVLPLKRGVRYLLNPGSVGQPRDGDWRAAFGLFDTEDYSFTFYRVPYHITQAQEKILDAGLPERLAYRLAEGR